MYSENYKTSLNKSKEGLSKECIHAHELLEGLILTVKKATLQKVIYRLMQSLLKSQLPLLQKRKSQFSNSNVTAHDLQVVKIIMKKKNKFGKLLCYNFKTYFKATVITMMWY